MLGCEEWKSQREEPEWGLHRQGQPEALQERKVRRELKKAEEPRRGRLRGASREGATVQADELGLILDHTVEEENSKGRVN